MGPKNSLETITAQNLQFTVKMEADVDCEILVTSHNTVNFMLNMEVTVSSEICQPVITTRHHIR